METFFITVHQKNKSERGAGAARVRGKKPLAHSRAACMCSKSILVAQQPRKSISESKGLIG